MQAQPTPTGLTVRLDSPADTDRLGVLLADLARPNTVIGLVGPLGAGKTRLTRALAGALGVDPDEVTSPTFTLIHEYEGRLPVFHFDAYRLGGPAPFEALGPGDYWEANGVCLVEWADLVAGLLPDSAWWVTLSHLGGDARRAELRNLPGETTARLLTALDAGFDGESGGS